MHLTQKDRDWIAKAIREGVREGLKPVEKRLDGIGDAVLIVAENLSGTVPGQDSHVVRKVRRALSRQAPVLPMAAKDR